MTWDRVEAKQTKTAQRERSKTTSQTDHCRPVSAADAVQHWERAWTGGIEGDEGVQGQGRVG